MTTLEFLLDPGMAPFTGALALVAGLLVVELVMSLVGASLLGDTDGADFDSMDADGLDTGEIELGDTDLAEADLDGPDGAEGPDGNAGGIASWLGFGDVPFVLWLAGFLTAFGLVGYGIQSLATGIIGGTSPWPFAVALSALPSLYLGGRFARFLGRLVPKTETAAINRRSLGDRRGVVIQGTARRGKPAQAKVTDGHGNWHYVRIEPVDDIAIPSGTEVLIRGGRDPVLKAIPLDDIPTE